VRLLVTGAAGFIGSNFVRYWLSERPDDHVVAYDALTYAGNIENLSDVRDLLVFVHGDICDAKAVERVMTAEEIDTIVNFAAESHNSYSLLDPTAAFRTNVLGTQTLLQAARTRGVTRFHHVSTCEVYGDLPLDSNEKFTEDSPYRPHSPYNASKAAGDLAVRAYHEAFGLPTTITNVANTYGPYQFPEKLIPLFATNALDDKPLPLYASTEYRREWIHVLDHCRGIERVLLDGRIGETYNIGTGVERSIMEIADAILGCLRKPSSLKTIVPDRPAHDRRYPLDSTKIATELGWKPQIPFDEGLGDTVRWYAGHRSWWEPLRERAPVEETAWAATPSW
jgi:dTDP-glucose 4,6-dehydratase